jgi:hypothetical protein
VTVAMRACVRVPTRLAVAVIVVASGGCARSSATDASVDAAIEAAPCDGTPPDGRVCETVCYSSTPSGIVPAACEVFCDAPDGSNAVTMCYTPDGGAEAECTLVVESDSPPQVLC